MDFFLQILVSGFVVGGIYALVALGFVLIYKSSDAINFAQGEFLLVGAYVSLTLIATYQIPLVPALILTLIFSAVLGLIIERLVLRPDRIYFRRGVYHVAAGGAPGGDCLDIPLGAGPG
ncbi:hypothetical protein GCM10010965_16110 [Caldalkalibacillus thermarum]|uniref:ABC transporter permease subunit n=1 Tax=Caldalkalibacillus thermarum TaxID=296745 RepID=UPI0016692EB4|nr:hypothetical protein [Caldalkalibacillus thermarum]GGK24119.1 hypothetical protein GCM10010965_16110 [Caldalkalibacillus thermarum]